MLSPATGLCSRPMSDLVCCKHAAWQSRVRLLSALEYMQGVEVNEPQCRCQTDS